MNKIIAHKHTMGKVQGTIEVPYGNNIGLYIRWICMDGRCDYHVLKFHKNKNLSKFEKIKLIVQKYTLNNPEGKAGYLEDMRIIDSLCE